MKTNSPKSLQPPGAKLIIVCDNWRSCHNVGAMIRSAARFGVNQFAFVGTTPYPRLVDDPRLPHLIRRQTLSVAKTALGAEVGIVGRYYLSCEQFLDAHKHEIKNWLPIEQTQSSQPLADWPGPVSNQQPVWLVLGGEIDGVGPEFLNLGPAWEISVVAPKQSLNVAVAGGICLYQLSATWSGWGR